MPHGLDTRGKYFNSTSPEEVNRGVQGKFSIEQLEERKELHAKRLHSGNPTIQDICDHFAAKYNIIVAYQSEKEWAVRQKNRANILAKQEDMINSGDLEIVSLSTQSLIQSLSSSAQSEAAFLRIVKSKAHTALKGFDADFSPWNIVGVTRQEYLNATPDQIKVWKPQVALDLSVKKDQVSAAKDLSKIMKDHSEEVREMVKQADEIGRNHATGYYAGQKQESIEKKKKELKKATQENKITGAENIEFKEVDIQAAREAVYGKSH